MAFDIRYATKEQLEELQRHIDERRQQEKSVQTKPDPLPTPEQMSLWEQEAVNG